MKKLRVYRKKVQFDRRCRKAEQELRKESARDLPFGAAAGGKWQNRPNARVLTSVGKMQVATQQRLPSTGYPAERRYCPRSSLPRE